MKKRVNKYKVLGVGFVVIWKITRINAKKIEEMVNHHSSHFSQFIIGTENSIHMKIEALFKYCRQHSPFLVVNRWHLLDMASSLS